MESQEYCSTGLGGGPCWASRGCVRKGTGHANRRFEEEGLAEALPRASRA